MKKIKNFLVILGLFITFILNGGSTVFAQKSTAWTPQQRIPGYENETWPPILIADRNRTVHAFSSQWMDGDKGPTLRAIMYNQWTLERGWTTPIDILLSPLKNDARLLDAFLDQSGIVHVIFWGGDSSEANIYYSSAPIAEAGDAHAWSTPNLIAEKAQDPGNGVFFVENINNIGVLFSGRQEGSGVYVIYSHDGGNSWSRPELLFMIGDLLVNDLQIYHDQSGHLNVIWNEINVGAQGRGIYYTSAIVGEYKWRTPIILAEAESGFGTQTPAIIKYHDTVFAFYNVGGSIGIVMRRSMDGGENWSEPVKLFRRHVGVNGSLSTVVDGNDELHLFFGQRITGNLDIHGMWHSVWQGVFWSEPEAIVSGPKVWDLVGDKGFDPFEARAVVSQGNLIMVTWQTDASCKGNGVWYSYKKVDAPEVPIEALPSLSVQDNATSEPTAISPTSATTPTLEPVSNQIDSFRATPQNSVSVINNSNSSLGVGLIPLAILIPVAVIYILYHRRQR